MNTQTGKNKRIHEKYTMSLVLWFQHMMDAGQVFHTASIFSPPGSTIISSQPQSFAMPTTGEFHMTSPTGMGYPQGLRGWSSGLCGCADDVSSCK